MPAISLTLAAPALAPPIELSGRQRVALDDDAALAACTTWQAGSDGRREARTRLVLQGLHCVACAGLIEAALERLDGVHAARVNVRPSAPRSTGTPPAPERPP